MAGTAAALIAIGVAVMFIPGSLLFHLVTGISAIACGLIVLAMGADMRRRFRRASSAYRARPGRPGSYRSARASQGRCGAAACWPSGQDRW
jgi:hypothetical protein